MGTITSPKKRSRPAIATRRSSPSRIDSSRLLCTLRMYQFMFSDFGSAGPGSVARASALRAWRGLARLSGPARRLVAASTLAAVPLQRPASAAASSAAGSVQRQARQRPGTSGGRLAPAARASIPRRPPPAAAGSRPGCGTAAGCDRRVGEAGSARLRGAVGRRHRARSTPSLTPIRYSGILAGSIETVRSRPVARYDHHVKMCKI